MNKVSSGFLSNGGIAFDGYLSNKKRIKVFEQRADGELRITKQFQQLWFDLFDIGIFLNRGGLITSDIPFPLRATSKLIGTSFLTDPSSIVRVVSFDLLTTNGAITTGGFELQTFNTGLYYKVSYKLLKKKKITGPSRLDFIPLMMLIMIQQVICI